MKHVTLKSESRLPGIDRRELQIEAKENTIRISGKSRARWPVGLYAGTLPMIHGAMQGGRMIAEP